MRMTFRLFLPLLAAFAMLSPATAQQTPPVQAEPVPFTQQVKDEILAGVKQILQERAFVPKVDFKKWDELIAARKDKLDAAANENDFTREVNAILREFGISHVGLRTPRTARSRQAGTTTGLGMAARPNDTGLLVTSVAPESPAAKAGMVVGDVILEIDGKPAKDLNALPREPGKEATLKLRKADGSETEVKVSAGEFKIQSRDSLTWLDDKTAVLRINSFSTGYVRGNVEKFMTEAAKADYLVVDLRNNGGGAVNNLSHLLGFFVPSGDAVGSFVNKQTVTDYEKAMGATEWTINDVASWTERKFKPTKPPIPVFAGKVAVLINRGSASASEIFAAGMQDTIGAKIVGSKSRGAVLASVYGRLPAGFEIQYPVSDYVTIKGQRLEGNPVNPDVVVEVGRPEEGKDPVMEAALTALKGN